MTPFVFVPHGAPDPVTWKRAHPGWVSFPATFVPHKRPTPKWTVLNGKRWPLDKRGQPWPSSRFGQPMCPLDEFPPGMPAPGTQGVYLRERAEAERKLIEGGSYDVAGYLAASARLRTGREARAAPAPAAYPDNGWGAARAYLAWSEGMAAQGREAAGAARQRDPACETRMEATARVTPAASHRQDSSAVPAEATYDSAAIQTTTNEQAQPEAADYAGESVLLTGAAVVAAAPAGTTALEGAGLSALSRGAASLLGMAAARATLLGGVLWPSSIRDGTMTTGRGLPTESTSLPANLVFTKVRTTQSGTKPATATEH